MSDPFPSFNLPFLNLPTNVTLTDLSTAVKAKLDALMPDEMYPGNVKEMRSVLWKLGIKDSVVIGYERCSALRGKGVWGIVEGELLAAAQEGELSIRECTEIAEELMAKLALG